MWFDFKSVPFSPLSMSKLWRAGVVASPYPFVAGGAGALRGGDGREERGVATPDQ